MRPIVSNRGEGGEVLEGVSIDQTVPNHNTLKTERLSELQAHRNVVIIQDHGPMNKLVCRS